SELGPLSFGKKEEQIFLGREIAQHRDYSEETAIKIDEQVRRLVITGYETAKKIMDEHSDVLVRIAEALLERETLDAEDMKALIDGQPLPSLKSASSDDKPQQVTLPDGGVRVSGPGLIDGERPQ